MKLGAGYLLKGTIRRWKDSFRFNVRLVEASTARQLWAGGFDGEDLPGAHDEIAAKVTNALAIQVDASLLADARRRPRASLEAYECWLRGVECLKRGTSESDAEGRRFFEQALKIDPHFGRAHAGISLSHFNEWSCQAWEDWEAHEKAAYEHALRADSMDPNDAVSHVILARIEQYRREYDRASAHFEKAHMLAPNNASVLFQLAVGHAFDGNPELGLEFLTRGLELNPFPPASVHFYAMVIHFNLRRYKEALECASKVPPRSIVDTPAFAAAACAYLDDLKAAARHLKEFKQDFAERIVKEHQPTPGELLKWTLHVNPFRRAEDIEHLAEGLKLAGLDGTHKQASPMVSWPVANAFRREGAVWMLAFDHQVAQMPELRGFHDIARLLATPGNEINSCELAGLEVKSAGIDVLDDKAKRVYRDRLAQLEEEIRECSDADDINHAKQLEGEREAIIAELRRATGLGGRARKTGASDERARTAVTWRIRNAIKKIDATHPPLARHLENSIRTGAFCSYQPEQPVVWQL
jgi:tetratricopeptide (TPR) repeat protein